MTFQKIKLIMEEYKIKLLKLVAEYDIQHTLFWSEDLSFYFLCNDFFYWGCADAEDIENQEDVDLLEQCIKDCRAVQQFGENHATELFCARKQKMRPQGAFYKFIKKEFWPLFDACGPEREVDIVNPEPQPTE